MTVVGKMPMVDSNTYFVLEFCVSGFVPCIRSGFSPKLSVKATDTIYRKFIATFVWRSTEAEERSE